MTLAEKRKRAKEIKELHAHNTPVVEIARIYGIAPNTVRRILNGIANFQGVKDRHQFWRVIADPLDIFTGGVFMSTDLNTGIELQTWYAGLQFQNEKTAQIRTVVKDGELICLK